MKNSVKVLVTLVLFNFSFNSLPTFFNYDYTKCQVPPTEPRLAKPWLSTVETEFFVGTTDKSFDRKGNKQELFGVHGHHNMRLLGDNIPTLANPILLALAALPARKTFGMLEFRGQFETMEINTFFTQNFSKGFFCEMFMPIVTQKINNIKYTDLSPEDGIYPDKSAVQWTAFLNNFDDILEEYKIDIKDTEYKGLGDVGLFFGWSYSKDIRDFFDFVDATIKLGYVIPVEEKSDPEKAFSICSGTDGHHGLYASLDAAFGTDEWFTIGVHTGALLLLEKTKEIRIKTNQNQSGFIKLPKVKTKIQPGIIWELGTFFKADHIVPNLSLITGYSLTKKDSDLLIPQENISSSAIASSDKKYQGWTKHTLSFGIELDFAKEYRRFNPFISFSYNLMLEGSQVFKTNLAGGSIGVDIVLRF